MAKTTMGQRIRAARKNKGLTIVQLSKILRLKSPTVLGDYERGKRGLKRPNIEFCLKLADALEVSIDYLFLGYEKGSKPTSKTKK